VTETTIRLVAPGDLDRLATLHRDGFARPWSAAEIATLIAPPAGLGLVAETDGACTGFCIVWAVADESEILTIAVAPEARRSGVGAALLTAAMVAASARGAETMTLEVAEDNLAARALYARRGFREVARRRAYYAAPNAPAQDALVLKRRLLDT
jgi:ribosomal-protein-alanine N-acetyltransferase